MADTKVSAITFYAGERYHTKQWKEGIQWKTAGALSNTGRRSAVFNYQTTTRLEGAIYILSVFLTLKVSYHSGKFLGGMLARR